MSLASRASARPAAAPFAGLVAVLLALSIAAQVWRDRGWQPYQPENPLLWVSSGPLLQRLALSYDSLAADVYWIRAVVYYGGKRRAEGAQRRYDALYPLLDLVTSLDPHFRIAYRFGAVFLAETYPAGPGRPDQAVQLLERAIERDFGRWEYFHDIGFVYYWWLRDYQKAAEWFERAANQPNAAEWLRPLAATTLAVGGDRASSRKLWSQLRDTTDSDWIRRNAEHRLMQLDALDVIVGIERLTAEFHSRYGRYPANWAEAARTAGQSGVPVDPSGVPYVLNASTGKVDVSPKSPLWPLPTPPASNPSPVP